MGWTDCYEHEEHSFGKTVFSLVFQTGDGLHGDHSNLCIRNLRRIGFLTRRTKWNDNSHRIKAPDRIYNDTCWENGSFAIQDLALPMIASFAIQYTIRIEQWTVGLWVLSIVNDGLFECLLTVFLYFLNFQCAFSFDLSDIFFALFSLND